MPDSGFRIAKYVRDSTAKLKCRTGQTDTRYDIPPCHVSKGKKILGSLHQHWLEEKSPDVPHRAQASWAGVSSSSACLRFDGIAYEGSLHFKNNLGLEDCNCHSRPGRDVLWLQWTLRMTVVECVQLSNVSV